MEKDHLKHLINLAASLSEATHEYYKKQGITYAEVPEIVGITGACENVDTLFRVGNRLQLPLFMSQTGQLSLEHILQYVPAVYTTLLSGRDEEVEDERHLRQFRLTEEEFDWSLVGTQGEQYDEEKMYEALLIHIENAVKYIAQKTITDNREALEYRYQQNTANLIEGLQLPFLRILYEEALELLRKNGFPELQWGDDLKANHEAAIVQLLNSSSLNRPVFIMRYPKEIKFFSMKVSEKDARVALSADLIFPLAGEGVGSAVREHRGDILRERLLSSTMFRLHQQRGGSYEDFVWYVDDLVGAGKTRPHAGYGLGVERLLQYIVGEKDIRNCSTFSLMARQTHDWEPRTITKVTPEIAPVELTKS